MLEEIIVLIIKQLIETKETTTTSSGNTIKTDQTGIIRMLLKLASVNKKFRSIVFKTPSLFNTITISPNPIPILSCSHYFFKKQFKTISWTPEMEWFFTKGIGKLIVNETICCHSITIGPCITNFGFKSLTLSFIDSFSAHSLITILQNLKNLQHLALDKLPSFKLFHFSLLLGRDKLSDLALQSFVNTRHYSTSENHGRNVFAVGLLSSNLKSVCKLGDRLTIYPKVCTDCNNEIVDLHNLKTCNVCSMPLPPSCSLCLEDLHASYSFF